MTTATDIIESVEWTGFYDYLDGVYRVPSEVAREVAYSEDRDADADFIAVVASAYIDGRTRAAREFAGEAIR